MTLTSLVFFRRFALRVAQATLAAILGFLSVGAFADDSQAPMLSLGDSVVFGFIDEGGYAYVNPDNFLAYPKVVGDALHLSSVNPSCPGETTSSFLSSTGADNGCRDYRSYFPLHVSFTGTQLDYARSFLGTHRNTRLVTLSLGANDLFLVQASCNNDPTCISAALPSALSAVYSNLNTILSNLRASGMRGVLMVVNYYSLDYSDPAQTAFTIALNSTIANAAAAHGAIVADAFTAFQKVASSPFAAGSTCKAGLLNGSVTGTSPCDVHPTLTGQRLLAQTVQAAYLNSRRFAD